MRITFDYIKQNLDENGRFYREGLFYVHYSAKSYYFASTIPECTASFEMKDIKQYCPVWLNCFESGDFKYEEHIDADLDYLFESLNEAVDFCLNHNMKVLRMIVSENTKLLQMKKK